MHTIFTLNFGVLTEIRTPLYGLKVRPPAPDALRTYKLVDVVGFEPTVPKRPVYSRVGLPNVPLRPNCLVRMAGLEPAVFLIPSEVAYQLALHPDCVCWWTLWESNPIRHQ